MVHTFEYPKKAQNTVKRYNGRATYQLEDIHRLINETKVLHVSFAPDPEDVFPAILPMIGVMGSFEFPSSGLDEPLDCYLHGYVSSRLMRLARDSVKGLPICIAASSVDGLVLALTPNSHSYNYRSAVLQGFAKPVDGDEKLFAMELITNKVVPGRYNATRIPPDKVEMTSTMILKVTIETGSAKVRHGEPHDEAKDLDREDVTSSTWTGVIPVWEVCGEPIPSSTNKVRVVPDYITSFVKDSNTSSIATALEAAKE